MLVASILQTLVDMCTAGQAIELCSKTTFELHTTIRSVLFIALICVTSYCLNNERILFVQSIFWADGHHLASLYSKGWHHLFFFLSFSPLLNETLRTFLGHVSLLFFCVSLVKMVHFHHDGTVRNVFNFFGVIDKGWHSVARLFVKDQLGSDITSVVFSYLDCPVDVKFSIHIFFTYAVIINLFYGHWFLNWVIFSFLMYYRWKENENALKIIFCMSTFFVYLMVTIRVLVDCGLLPKPRNKGVLVYLLD